jgi:hypothetical protein
MNKLIILQIGNYICLSFAGIFRSRLIPLGHCFQGHTADPLRGGEDIEPTLRKSNPSRRRADSWHDLLIGLDEY